MKPATFEYLRPRSLDDALSALARHPEAAVLAGGQSLIAMLNLRLATPSHLVDISRLGELRQIAIADGSLRLGALVRHCELESDPTVAEAAPLLRRAAAGLAHPAIRNRGTLGGSLALADPAAELPAAVLALGARLEIIGHTGARLIEASDFFRGPFETALAQGELLCAVEIPLSSPARRSDFEKLARRQGDYALAGLAAHGSVQEDRILDLRLAYFGVGARPTLASETAARLEGAALSAAAVEAALAELERELAPVDQPGCSGATKLHLAKVLTRRVLARLV